MAESGGVSDGGRVAFQHPGFVIYLLARWFIVAGLEMQSVAVGWQVYELTRRPLDLGYVGLAQFLPGILLFLVSGHTADRFNRKTVLVVCFCGYGLCSAMLLRIAFHGSPSVMWIYVVMVLVGVSRSFTGPASRAIMPQLVPLEHFQNAVAWNSTMFQSATILGPALGGVIYAAFRGPAAVYALALVGSITAAFLMMRVKTEQKARPREPVNWQTMAAGMKYIWSHKVILGSISLDLFAVLLGGAVALLPVYAREILKTGPWGLGLLRCAPGIGAAAMAILIAYKPLRRRSGIVMLWCVAGFGLFTILFGISKSLILSLIALGLVGATDMVSVIVRGVLVQIATPDEMRGRVNAVDMIFIGASNQFGEFESGLTAQWFGTVPAVVLGGIGTLLVTALWAWMFPELRNADRLTDLKA
ncbi:MAG TPA: MFS transporter [Candidatus Acidoferrum sp.]|nr:MFS transporter [Candidatus Acidoferrum sp.]